MLCNGKPVLLSPPTCRRCRQRYVNGRAGNSNARGFATPTSKQLPNCLQALSCTPSLAACQARREGLLRLQCCNRFQIPTTARAATAQQQAASTLLADAIAHPSLPRCSQARREGLLRLPRATTDIRVQHRRPSPLPMSKQLPHCSSALSRTPPPLAARKTRKGAAPVAALQPLPDSSDGACRHCPAASSIHTACRRYRAPLAPSLQPGEKREAATVAACNNRYQSPATAPVATADEQAVATLLAGTIVYTPYFPSSDGHAGDIYISFHSHVHPQTRNRGDVRSARTLISFA